MRGPRVLEPGKILQVYSKFNLIKLKNHYISDFYRCVCTKGSKEEEGKEKKDILSDKWN